MSPGSAARTPRCCANAAQDEPSDNRAARTLPCALFPQRLPPICVREACRASGLRTVRRWRGRSRILRIAGGVRCCGQWEEYVVADSGRQPPGNAPARGRCQRRNRWTLPRMSQGIRQHPLSRARARPGANRPPAASPPAPQASDANAGTRRMCAGGNGKSATRRARPTGGSSC